jgi:hypothetical protein
MQLLNAFYFLFFTELRCISYNFFIDKFTKPNCIWRSRYRCNRLIMISYPFKTHLSLFSKVEILQIIDDSDMDYLVSTRKKSIPSRLKIFWNDAIWQRFNYQKQRIIHKLVGCQNFTIFLNDLVYGQYFFFGKVYKLVL